MRLLRRLVELWRAHAEPEIGGPELANVVTDEMRAEVIRHEKLPTMKDAYGCVNCGVIQPRPVDFRCGLCRSAEIVNLTLQLQRGSKRIQKKRAETRRIHGGGDR